MFQAKVVEKLETRILCFANPPSPANCAVYEIMWKSMVDPGRPQMTIERMRIACWIPKATNIHTSWVILNAFQLQQLLHERASMLRYTYNVCIVICFNRYICCNTNDNLLLPKKN
jgi:hypothetical protein